MLCFMHRHIDFCKNNIKTTIERQSIAFIFRLYNYLYVSYI